MTPPTLLPATTSGPAPTLSTAEPNTSSDLPSRWLTEIPNGVA